MTKINRRKFVSIFGLVSIGSIAKISQNAKSMNIDVNRFQNDRKVNLENIETVAFKMKEITITSNNIDYKKDARLSVYASVEGQDIGKVKTIENIDIKKSETNLDDDIIIKLGNSDLFSYNKYSNDKNTLHIELTFELEHESVNTIKQTEEYSLDIGLSPGELISTDGFGTNGQYSDKPNNDRIISISSGELDVFSKSGIGQIKQLVQGPAVYNKSSQTIASGGIDPDNIRFDYSNFRDNPEISYVDEDNAVSINSGELDVFSKSGIDQIKQLVQGPAVYNKSSQIIASGGIDPDNIRFDYSNFRDNPEISYVDEDNAVSINSGELDVFSKSGIDQIKQLVQGPAVYNKSSQIIASGGIDPDNIRFDYSNFRDNPEISYNEPDPVIIDFK